MCVISWIHSYLAERSSYVKVDTSFSSQSLPTGVPQGSVLRYLLFVLFISPFVSAAKLRNYCQMRIQLFLFVNMLMTFSCILVLTHLHWPLVKSLHLNPAPSRLLQNGLHLNPSKSKAIAFYYLLTLAKSIQSISVAGSFIELQSSIKSQTPKCLLTSRFLKYAEQHTFTFVLFVTLDPLLPLTLQKQSPWKYVVHVTSCTV